MAKSESSSSGNVFLDNPGVTASVFATVVLFVFLFALYRNATSHHEGGHDSGSHPSAPAH
jgi:hypothetical protein